MVVLFNSRPTIQLGVFFCFSKLSSKALCVAHDETGASQVAHQSAPGPLKSMDAQAQQPLPRKAHTNGEKGTHYALVGRLSTNQWI